MVGFPVVPPSDRLKMISAVAKFGTTSRRRAFVCQVLGVPSVGTSAGFSVITPVVMDVHCTGDTSCVCVSCRMEVVGVALEGNRRTLISAI